MKLERDACVPPRASIEALPCRQVNSPRFGGSAFLTGATRGPSIGDRPPFYGVHHSSKSKAGLSRHSGDGGGDRKGDGGVNNADVGSGSGASDAKEGSSRGGSPDDTTLTLSAATYIHSMWPGKTTTEPVKTRSNSVGHARKRHPHLRHPQIWPWWSAATRGRQMRRVSATMPESRCAVLRSRFSTAAWPNRATFAVGPQAPFPPTPSSRSCAGR